LTQDKERQFTPKPCDFDYAKKTIQHLKKKQNNIVLTAICHINQVTVLTQMILQLKPSALTMELLMQTMEPLSTQATPLNTLQKKPETTSRPSKMLTQVLTWCDDTLSFSVKTNKYFMYTFKMLNISNLVLT
jgi:hypothetical protein